jgi:hypothetical protein
MLPLLLRILEWSYLSFLWKACAYTFSLLVIYPHINTGLLSLRYMRRDLERESPAGPSQQVVVRFRVTSCASRLRSAPNALKHELRNVLPELGAHFDLDPRVLPRVDPAQASLRRNVVVAGKRPNNPW